MKKLPLGISTFSEIITGNYVYIDKTKFAWNLITKRKVLFFNMSLPVRNHKKFSSLALISARSKETLLMFGGKRFDVWCD